MIYVAYAVGGFVVSLITVALILGIEQLIMEAKRHRDEQQ